jgi:hypothetical protein
MVRRPKIPFITQLAATSLECRKLQNQVLSGEPRVYIMGHLYPEEMDSILGSDSWKKIDYAIADLEHTRVAYNDAAEIISEMAKDLDELAGLMKARDVFVSADIERMREAMNRVRIR